MSNLAKDNPLSADAVSDLEIKTRAEMLRAAINSIPVHQRPAVFEQVRDLFPKAPQRGGEVLNNVYELFKRDTSAVLAAPEVKERLERSGKDAEIQSVRNALTYLQGRSILRRIGYGQYQLADGRIVDGLP